MAYPLVTTEVSLAVMPLKCILTSFSPSGRLSVMMKFFDSHFTGLSSSSSVLKWRLLSCLVVGQSPKSSLQSNSSTGGLTKALLVRLATPSCLSLSKWPREEHCDRLAHNTKSTNSFKLSLIVLVGDIMFRILFGNTFMSIVSRFFTVLQWHIVTDLWNYTLGLNQFWQWQ